VKTQERLTVKSIKAACFSKRNWEKAVGPLKGLEINSSLISKNPEKKERYLKVRLYKTLRINNYYNLNVKGV